MLYRAKAVVLGAVLLAGFSLPAVAADLVEPQPPMVEVPQYAPVNTGGWYIRGDVDYHWSNMRGSDYITYGPPAGTGSFTTTDLNGAWSLGGGVGYKVNRYFRTDLTADYLFKSDFNGHTVGTCNGGPCSSDDASAYSALLLLANAYADLGTYHGFTPYVGAGIGGARIKWDDLHNVIGGGTTIHKGDSNWRFAYALMAGVSYCLTRHIDLDVGYRFTHINGGQMFDYAPVAGPGFDHGINVNEVRAGLRYNFGPQGGYGCGPEAVAYQPPVPAPVYK